MRKNKRNFMIECLNQIGSDLIFGGDIGWRGLDIVIHGFDCILRVQQIGDTEYSVFITSKSVSKNEYWSVQGWLEAPKNSYPYLQGHKDQGILKRGVLPALPFYNDADWFFPLKRKNPLFLAGGFLSAKRF